MSNEKDSNSGRVRHTPGPWVIVNSFVVFNSDTRDKAVLIADCGSTIMLDDTEKQANARLIAASPKLLAALEALAGRWDGCPLDQCPREVKDARAVIAEAKGE